MTLRPYQADAAQAALDWMKRSTAPFVIDAATGAGKSHIIAEIAAVIHGMTGKRVLCLAPSAELVVQNREKFLATGNKASTFSASAGAKGVAASRRVWVAADRQKQDQQVSEGGPRGLCLGDLGRVARHNANGSQHHRRNEGLEPELARLRSDGHALPPGVRVDLPRA